MLNCSLGFITTKGLRSFAQSSSPNANSPTVHVCTTIKFAQPAHAYGKGDDDGNMHARSPAGLG